MRRPHGPPAGEARPVPDEPVAPAAPAGGPSGRRRLIRSAAGLVAVLLLAAAVVGTWDEGSRALAGLSPLPVAGAFVLVLLGLVASTLSWRALLAGLGSPLPVPVAARIHLVAQLGKYVPGSLWPVLAQAELGRDHGVPRARSGVAAGAALVVGVVVGAVVAAACLGLTAATQVLGYGWALLVVPAGLLLLAPATLQRVLRLATRLTGRRVEVARIEDGALLRAAGWSALMWAAFGGHVWLLADALGAGPASGVGLLLLCSGAYALAWIVGFLVVLAPAGAGAREAALVLALSPVLVRGEALALALVSRVLMLAGDVLVALAALALARARRRTRRPV